MVVVTIFLDITSRRVLPNVKLHISLKDAIANYGTCKVINEASFDNAFTNTEVHTYMYMYIHVRTLGYHSKTKFSL